jgi:predicted glutamine amidotransferase
MCRLVAVRSKEPRRAAGLLVEERNSLLQQSCCDSRGESHGDGWGIGSYAAGQARLVRSPHSAQTDPDFRATAETISTNTLIGHIRQASVGGNCLENSHPFVLGRWMFAHNGTVTGFEHVQSFLEHETDPGLLAARRGTTDSELVFLWLLSQAIGAGVATPERASDPQGLISIVGRAIGQLVQWSEQALPEEKAKLNFILTDGDFLLATRWNHSLHWAPDSGSAVLVASEPIGDHAWQELPEASILTIDAAIEARIEPL